MTTDDVARAVTALREGRVVAAATESFFGLLVDARRRDAIDALFALKPRGAEQGVPLLLPDRAAWGELVRGVPELAGRLADAFWPGPLSISLPAAAHVDARLTLGRQLALRLPGACVAAEIARAFGGPLTATSANRPGAPPATSSDEVTSSFESAVADRRLVVIDGRSPGGSPSTVVVVSSAGFVVARAGAVTVEQLEAVAGPRPSVP